MLADIVVFRPGEVRDAATYTEPHRLAEGVDYLIVNGVPTLLEGKASGRRAGRFLEG
jgi:N-acyl-D-amino-acid deacylase